MHPVSSKMPPLIANKIAAGVEAKKDANGPCHTWIHHLCLNQICCHQACQQEFHRGASLQFLLSGWDILSKRRRQFHLCDTSRRSTIRRLSNKCLRPQSPHINPKFRFISQLTSSSQCHSHPSQHNISCHRLRPRNTKRKSIFRSTPG